MGAPSGAIVCAPTLTSVRPQQEATLSGGARAVVLLRQSRLRYVATVADGTSVTAWVSTVLAVFTVPNSRGITSSSVCQPLPRTCRPTGVIAACQPIWRVSRGCQDLIAVRSASRLISMRRGFAFSATGMASRNTPSW